MILAIRYNFKWVSFHTDLMCILEFWVGARSCSKWQFKERPLKTYRHQSDAIDHYSLGGNSSPFPGWGLTSRIEMVEGCCRVHGLTLLFKDFRKLVGPNGVFSEIHSFVPETHIAPWNFGPSQKETIVFQPSIFRGYVGFREGMACAICVWYVS